MCCTTLGTMVTLLTMTTKKWTVSKRGSEMAGSDIQTQTKDRMEKVCSLADNQTEVQIDCTTVYTLEKNWKITELRTIRKDYMTRRLMISVHY